MIKLGRPVLPGVGAWRNSDILARRVKGDLEALTSATYRLLALAARVLGRSLTPEECDRLKEMVPRAKPSVITRTLLTWRFNLSDETVRDRGRQVRTRGGGATAGRGGPGVLAERAVAGRQCTGRTR